MNSDATAPFRLGSWRVHPALGQIQHESAGSATTLEPRVMELLLLLVEHAGEVVPRARIEDALWGEVVVGEDTVARTVSKLRRALGDSAKAPAFIDTLPKRGYRLIAPVMALTDSPTPEQTRPGGVARPRALPIALLLVLMIGVVTTVRWSATSRTPQNETPPSLAATLTTRADDRYMRFTRGDNEAAIVLYERALGQDAAYGPAHAGLANALVQRVIRWPPSSASAEAQAATLGEALARGLHKTQQSREILIRATAMAERAARLDPTDADTLKALGLTYAAQGDFERAAQVYHQAIAADEDAWASMINLAEIFQLRGDSANAVATLAQAFDAMERRYDREPQHVGPWQGAVGVQVARLYESIGHGEEAELWYRRVLDKYPLDPDATRYLARLLASTGDIHQARQLCQNINTRLGDDADCALDAPPIGPGSDP